MILVPVCNCLFLFIELSGYSIFTDISQYQYTTVCLFIELSRYSIFIETYQYQYTNMFFFIGLSGHSSCGIPCHSEKDFRDVYLGGSCGDSNWREKIAIPILR